MSAAVPRVAESIEDLRVGQVVCERFIGSGEGWSVYAPMDGDIAQIRAHFHQYVVVILEDAPAEPVTVPAEAVERLREAVAKSRAALAESRIDEAARALLDAIDGAGA